MRVRRVIAARSGGSVCTRLSLGLPILVGALSVGIQAHGGVWAAGVGQAAGRDQAVEPREPIAAEPLPVSLERIKRRLTAVSADEADRLRLDYYVEVYGRAPAVDVFSNFDVHSGPVPYGAPVHADLMRLMTPQEFRSPAADLGSFFNWLLRRERKPE